MSDAAIVKRVVARLRRGDPIHMQILEGRREWWLESPRLDCSDAIVEAVKTRVGLIEAKDSLFGLPDNSQTWVLDTSPKR